MNLLKKAFVLLLAAVSPIPAAAIAEAAATSLIQENRLTSISMSATIKTEGEK